MTVNESPRYNSPQAARQAVTGKLRVAAQSGSWPLPDLQRQYAYDQLVERLYRRDDAWVIKGATALLARRVSVRHTTDIDVYRAGAIGTVERLVREAVTSIEIAAQIGDWMTFELGPAMPITAAGAQGARVRVSAFIGATVWAQFHIDLVADGIVMTGTPEQVPPLTDDVISSAERIPWNAYPLVDHVADKVCAILETHDGHASTRFKDLVDLVAISARGTVDAALQMRALAKEAHRRNLTLPAAFDVPDRALWQTGYRAEAKRTRGLNAADLDAALTVLRPMLDPLLDGTAIGVWDPSAARWA